MTKEEIIEAAEEARRDMEAPGPVAREFSGLPEGFRVSMLDRSSMKATIGDGQDFRLFWEEGNSQYWTLTWPEGFVRLFEFYYSDDSREEIASCSEIGDPSVLPAYLRVKLAEATQ